MGIHCSKEPLAAALGALLPLCGDKTTPILQNILIEPARGENGYELTLTAMRENAIRAVRRIPARSDGHGEPMLLPAKRLMDVLRALPGDDAELRSLKGKVRLVSGGSQFDLQASDPADYPAWQPLPTGDERSVTVNSTQLSECLQHAMRVCDDEGARYSFHCVGIDMNSCDGQVIKLFATDGRQLVIRAMTVSHNNGAMLGEYDSEKVCKIPLPSCKAIVGLLGTEVAVTMSMTSTAFRVSTRDMMCHGTAGSGRLPNYRSIVERARRFIASLNPPDVSRACRQAATVTTIIERGALFRFRDNQLQIQAVTADVGDADVSCLVSTDQEFETRLDLRYMIGALQSMPQNESVTWLQEDADSALAIVSDGRFHMLMPLVQT